MRKILIVDDHELVRRGLRGLLLEKFPGSRIAEATNSREDRGKIHGTIWDLVLLDINIPGRNGFEVLSELRRLHPQTPVIVLTVYPEEEFALRAFKLGANAYLSKRSASEELIAAVQKALSGGKYITPSLAERLAEAVGDNAVQVPHENLTERELQVLRLVAMGKSTREIAAELNLSVKTIATYRARISEKAGLATNVEIARYAMQHHLVE